MRVLNVKISKSQNYSGMFLTLILAISLNAFTNNGQAQTSFKSIASSEIKVNGTSNLHNWSMLATTFISEGNFTLKGGQLQDVTALSFSLSVNNLKSKEDLMNTRAYKALKAEQFNKITFKLTDATIVSQQKIIKATGNLTIAGVTKEVSLQTNYIVDGNEITCKGSKVIKMSDFKIKAPSFMLGALKTGDEVTIDIVLKLYKD